MPRWIFFILFLLAGFSVNVRAQEPVRTDTLPAAIKRASLLGRKTLSERVVIQKLSRRCPAWPQARTGRPVTTSVAEIEVLSGSGRKYSCLFLL